YEWLPLGLRVLRKVENIIREQMNNAGALEVFLPALQPRELWDKTKRWDAYGKELMRLHDRHERDFCLGPTHEEIITNQVAREVRSYRDLPLNLYQFQTKFRDEIRPRFGVMRAREFLMKDAYSFDVNDASAEESYKVMYETYNNIFKRSGLEFKVVEADTGAIGGSFSHEFMVLADTGESKIVYCECGYAANFEKAAAEIEQKSGDKQISAHSLEKVKTPNVKTVIEVSQFLKVPEHRFIKSLVYDAGGAHIMVLIRGDREVNEHKLASYLKCTDIRLASEEDVLSIFSCPIGFLGPVGLKDIRIIADNTIENIKDGVTGANAVDYHYIHIDTARDINISEKADLINVNESDKCIKCGKKLSFTRGIETAHVFKLGTKYSEPLEALYLDDKGEKKHIVMGCYGIGVSRVVAAAIEQNNDENGIIWTWALAPYHICIVPVDVTNKELMATAVEIYEMLGRNGYEVLLDDRNERAGVKFKDMDLIGIPVRITIGRKFLETGKAEIKSRRTGEIELKKKEDIAGYIEKIKEKL
ncbi:proline--tRNA ligase, partial [bacterium]